MKAGSYYTSAGVTADIDLALALIKEDYGPEVALRTAREMVVYLKRSGGQEQYSEPLRVQVESTEPIAGLGVWIRSHLRQDLSSRLSRNARLYSRGNSVDASSGRSSHHRHREGRIVLRGLKRSRRPAETASSHAFRRGPRSEGKGLKWGAIERISWLRLEIAPIPNHTLVRSDPDGEHGDLMLPK